MKFFDALKTVYVPHSSGTTSLLSADGTSLLTDKEAVLKRWAEHFDGVFNRPSSINDEAVNKLPQVECNPLLEQPVWIQERQRNNRHYLHSKTASREMPGTESWPLLELCWPYQSIWHSQSSGTLENYGKVWLSFQIHSNGVAVPQWYACKGPKWWRVFWSIPCDKSVLALTVKIRKSQDFLAPVSGSPGDQIFY